MGRTDGSELFAYIDLERLLQAEYPLRVIRTVGDARFASCRASSAGFTRLSRPGGPLEKPLRALVLQARRLIRSERQLMERLYPACCFLVEPLPVGQRRLPAAPSH